MTAVLAVSQAAYSAVSSLLASEPQAPGENPDGEGLVGLIIAVLEGLGSTAGMAVLGVLAFLAGGAWMWGRGR